MILLVLLVQVYVISDISFGLWPLRRSIPCMWGNHKAVDEVILPIPYPDAGQGPALEFRSVTRLRMDLDALEHNLDRMMTDGKSAFAAYCADLAPQCAMTAFGQGRGEGYRCCKNHVDKHCRSNEAACISFAPECDDNGTVGCELGTHSWRNPTATPLLQHINLYSELRIPSV